MAAAAEGGSIGEERNPVLHQSDRLGLQPENTFGHLQAKVYSALFQTYFAVEALTYAEGRHTTFLQRLSEERIRKPGINRDEDVGVLDQLEVEIRLTARTAGRLEPTGTLGG
jgi:hypothetical protein